MDIHEKIVEVIMENGFLAKDFTPEQMKIRAVYDSYRIINIFNEYERPCVHPYSSIIGEESGNPECLACGKKLG